ncbi:MAG: hypothetical protein ACFFCV_07000 [Promethearchaeota archaeon]
MNNTSTRRSNVKECPHCKFMISEKYFRRHAKGCPRKHNSKVYNSIGGISKQ